jgi:uncharacterized protein YerC
MEREKLKKIALDEFTEKVPQEIAKNEKKLHEFISKNINEPLLDKLVDEFCKQNPEEFAVLNPLCIISGEELKEIAEKIDVASMVEIIQYEKIINNAGLAYQADILSKSLMT